MTHPRIAPLLDDPFALPGDAPGRTEDGAIWVRWANVGTYAGWYAVGTRAPRQTGKQLPGKSDFWVRVYALAAEVGNGNVDAVHAVGPGILSVGGLGVTAASGYAQALLKVCLEEQPSRWLECMAPVMFEARVLPAASSPEELEAAIRGSKDREKLWVECCSHMLRDERFDAAQVKFLQRISADVLGPELVKQMGFTGNPSPMWSHEQRALWALAVVVSLADTALATKVIGDALLPEDTWVKAHPAASGPADATLRALRAEHPVGMPEHFTRRLRRTLELLPKHFEIPQGE